MTREEAIERFENVKANALVQKASGVSEYWQNEIDGTIEAIDMAIEALQADAVKVVRCKDCRWWSCKDSLYQHNSHLCRYWKSTNTSAEDFCSYGEKREEVNGFKSVGQAWNTSQGRWEP